MTRFEYQLKRLKTQEIFSLSNYFLKNNIFSNVYFLKVEENKYLVSNLLAGFIHKNILEKSYITLEDAEDLILEYMDRGYVISETSTLNSFI